MHLQTGLWTTSLGSTCNGTLGAVPGTEMPPRSPGTVEPKRAAKLSGWERPVSRRAEPQPEELAAAVYLRVIFKCAPVVLCHHGNGTTGRDRHRHRYHGTGTGAGTGIR